MTKISLDELDLELAYSQLKDTAAKLDSVKKPLPDYSSVSEAMREFRGKSKASKSLFTEYRSLFSKDVEIFWLNCQKLTEADEDVAGGFEEGSGGSAGGSGGGGGGSW